ncbi:MAG: thiol:disulfide interchange protein DsbD [Candidatus Krumholzibacteriia bacterium]|jgi:thiol:disulfide interchange protein DsbD
MMTPHIRKLLIQTLVLTFVLVGQSHAAPIALDVSVRDDLAVIGQDLIIDLVVKASDGVKITADQLTVNVSVDGGQSFFGSAYPLRLSSGFQGNAFEWAAPIGAEQTPADYTLKIDISYLGGDGAAENASWSGPVNVDFGDDWSADKIANYLDDRGLFLFLLVVFGFGLLMSLSPCIYPMIPITLAVIGGQSQEKGTAHGLVMSITYVIGMAFVYAIMGALSATVFSGITAFMQSPVVLIPIAILLLTLSFGMFGAFEMQAPAFLRDRLQGPSGGNKGGLIGVFAMGLVAGLVASPCVGPFLAALLVWVATTGNWFLGFITLFTFGMGMGMILIAVGTFPAVVGSMPQSGGWMESVKKGMGLLLVAMAFYFVRPGSVLPAHIFYPLVGVTTILVAVFMGAFEKVQPEGGWWAKASKGLGLAAFVAGLYLLLGSFLQYGFLMPSPLEGRQMVPQLASISAQPSTSVATNTAIATAQPLPEKVEWTKIHTGENVQAFLDEQRATAKAAGQPIMIDFWASWCVYCKKLDKMVWNQATVVAESQRFIRIKIDATVADDAEMEKIKEEMQVPGLPRVIFIDSRGEILHGRSSGFLPAEEMLTVMKSIR